MRKHSLKVFQIVVLFLLVQAGCTGRAKPATTPTPTIKPATVTPVQPSLTPRPTEIPATVTPEPPTSVPPNKSISVPAGSIEFTNPVNYEVEYIVTVYNDNFGLDKLLVYQPLPVDWDGQSDVTIEEISPEPTRKDIETTHSNGIIYWNVSSPPQAGESLPLKILFSFTGNEINTKVNPEMVEPYDEDNPLYKLYTKPERYIESTDSKIVDIANQVAGDETNPYVVARKIYDYVIETANYKLVGKGLLGAKALINNGVGECGDYASLFIALARAKGIPARPVVGYWAISGTDQTHVWAEFYLEGLGWIPVDPTIGQDYQRDYYFGNMDNQRVVLNKGFNVKLVPSGPDNYIAPFLQVPLWWYWGSSGDDNSVNLERTSWIVKELP